MKDIIGNSLPFSSGDLWKRQRRILTPMFHLSQLRSYLPALRREADNLVKRIDAKIGQPILIDEEILNFTLKAIISSAFGGRRGVDPQFFATRFNEFLAMLRTPMGGIMALLPAKHRTYLPVYHRTMQLLQECRDELQKAIDRVRERNSQEKNEDDEEKTVLDALVDARDPETGEQIDDGLVQDECLTFLLAGNGTTAAVLTWCVHLLSRDARVQSKVRAEARLAADNDTWSSSDMKYTKAVFMETMRLYPAVPILQGRTSEPTNFVDNNGNDVVVPTGVDCMINISALHRDQYQWGNDADKFRPERMLNKDAPLIDGERASPFRFLGFSAGSHACIGQKLAVQEAVLMIGRLCQQYYIVPENKQGEPLHDLLFEAGPDNLLVSFHRVEENSQ